MRFKVLGRGMGVSILKWAGFALEVAEETLLNSNSFTVQETMIEVLKIIKLRKMLGKNMKLKLKKTCCFRDSY